MPIPAGPRPRSAGRAASAYLGQFRDLTERVASAGLMQRCHQFYWTAFGACLTALVAAWTGVVVLRDSWWTMLLAAALGLVFAQLGFLGHEASHRQVFRSARWNDWSGRVVASLLVGISHGWWMAKHSRHHGAPNQLGRDPDVDSAAVAFSVDAVRRRRGLGLLLARGQSWFFVPLLALEGLSLHVSSVRRVLARGRLQHRAVEIAFLGTRLLGYLALVLVVLPPGRAAAFLAVQTLVFGLLLGGAFAPNHIGMPIVPRDLSIDFLRRQVLTSRNISGGPVVRFLMGGLDTQIEHHLFPHMPRPHLRRARALVRAYCSEHDITYTETTLLQAYRSVLAHLDQVGHGQRDLFACPLTQQHRS